MLRGQVFAAVFLPKIVFAVIFEVLYITCSPTNTLHGFLLTPSKFPLSVLETINSLFNTLFVEYVYMFSEVCASFILFANVHKYTCI